MRKFFTKHFFLLLLFGLSGIFVGRPVQAAGMDNVPVQVVQEWFQVPVLKFKTDNPVLRIRVSLNDETPVDLSDVLFWRSEVRRVGTGVLRTCRSCWELFH